ncbi:MAG: co-chaperone DjlA [Luminiphilus sp.]
MNAITGKVMAGIIGYLALGPVGLLFGIAIGHAFDRGLWQALQAANPENLARVQKQFFATTFTLLGYVAKADGRVSEAEVAQAEALFRQLRLNPAQRQDAIQRFKQGAESGFDPRGTITAFAQSTGMRRQARSTLLMFLASMALADGRLDGEERGALHIIAKQLGLPIPEVDRLLVMLSAQSRFHGGSGYQANQRSPETQLQDAYAALGLSESATDSDVKKTYRRLMSENHPDKLMAKGVPDEMLKLATERSQEISTAYEVIKDSRGMR